MIIKYNTFIEEESEDNYNDDFECNGCEYYNFEDGVCKAFVCDGIDCPALPCEK